MLAEQLEITILPRGLTIVSESPSLPVILGVHSIETMEKHEIRTIISNIEEMCKQFGEEIDIPVEHYFSKGVYAREMIMPQGALIVGKIHKHENLSILSAGEVSVLSVDGIKRIKAPYTFVASPGTKRVIYAHSEAVWTVIHGTDETDIEKIEEEFIAKDYEEIIFQESKCLGSQ
jgi:hypothetical protein